MGRPPIIISNKGVVEELVKHFKEADKFSAQENIKNAIADLNQKSLDETPDQPIVRKIKSKNKKDPRALWCLKSEKKDELNGKLKKWGCSDDASLDDEEIE